MTSPHDPARSERSPIEASRPSPAGAAAPRARHVALISETSGPPWAPLRRWRWSLVDGDLRLTGGAARFASMAEAYADLQAAEAAARAAA